MMHTFDYEKDAYLSYQVLAAWSVLEFVLTIMAGFVFKNGTKPTQNGNQGFLVERFYHYFGLLCLPWPALRTPWYAGAGVWASFSIYSNFLANPAMLYVALRYNRNVNLMSENPGEWFEPHLRARETVPPSTKPEP